MLEIRKSNNATYVAKVTDENNISYFFPVTVTDEEIKIQSVRALYDGWDSLPVEPFDYGDELEFYEFLKKYKNTELLKIVVTSDWDADHNATIYIPYINDDGVEYYTKSVELCYYDEQSKYPNVFDEGAMVAAVNAEIKYRTDITNFFETAKEKYLGHYYSPLLTAEEAEEIINNN